MYVVVLPNKPSIKALKMFEEVKNLADTNMHNGE